MAKHSHLPKYNELLNPLFQALHDQITVNSRRDPFFVPCQEIASRANLFSKQGPNELDYPFSFFPAKRNKKNTIGELRVLSDNSERAVKCPFLNMCGKNPQSSPKFPLTFGLFSLWSPTIKLKHSTLTLRFVPRAYHLWTILSNTPYPAPDGAFFLLGVKTVKPHIHGSRLMQTKLNSRMRRTTWVPVAYQQSSNMATQRPSSQIQWTVEPIISGLSGPNSGQQRTWPLFNHIYSLCKIWNPMHIVRETPLSLCVSCSLPIRDDLPYEPFVSASAYLEVSRPRANKECHC